MQGQEDVVGNRSTQIDSACDGGNMHNLSAESVPKMLTLNACSSVVCVHIGNFREYYILHCENLASMLQEYMMFFKHCDWTCGMV